MQPAVHTVGNAGERHRAVAVSKLRRRDIAHLRKVKLEVERLKIGAAQLRRHVRHYLEHILAEAAEEVYEPLRLLLKVVQLLMHIAVHMALGDCVQLVVRDGAEAAAVTHVARRVLQHVVHERADLRRREARRFIRARVQAVLAEIRKFAGGEFIYPRRAQLQPSAVERAHRLR